MSLLLEWFVSFWLVCGMFMSLLLECYFGLLRMFQWISSKICTNRIEAGSVVEIAKAHLPQSKFVHLIGDPTFGKSIAGIRQVDSWGAVAPTSVFRIGVSEHWANNGFYVSRSIVMLLYSGMWVRFGSFGMFLVSFLASRIFEFYLVKRSGNKSAICCSLFICLYSGCIVSWGFVPAVFSSD